MDKKQLWQAIKDNDPHLAELLLALQASFGKLKHVEVEFKPRSGEKK